jgi:hypothetical protein
VRLSDELALHARRNAPRLGPGRTLEPLVGGEPRRATTAQRALARADGGGRHVPQAVRRRRRDDGHTGVAAYLASLATLHHAPVTHAADPRSIDAPAAPDRPATGPLGSSVVGRLAARVLGTPHDGAALEPLPDVPPEELAAAWVALREHEPDAVTARVDAALLGGQLPGVTLDVRSGEVTVAVSVLPVDQLVGPRTPVCEGDSTRLKRADQERKHAVYAEVMDATVLAVAGTTLAVAPGAARVTVAVVCPQHLGGPAVLLVARCPRDLVLPPDAERVVADRLEDAVLDSSRDIARDRSETLGALRPLDDELPGLEALRSAVVLER